MPYRPVNVIEVRIWGERVGACALDPRSGYYAFEYTSDWLAKRIELAPLQMPVDAGSGPHVFAALPETTYRRLPAMLADAMPDDFGNSLIDAYMARQGVAKGAITALDRLAYMSRRGFGALEFRPARGPATTAKPSAIMMARLVESARRAIRGELLDDDLAKAALMQLLQVGTSAGGARAKAAVAWNPLTQEIRAGQFEVLPGFEHWLLKLDGVGKDLELGTGAPYGRIEYAYHLMARHAGIDMEDCRLLEENGRAHFMTRRFDRRLGEKLHLQSLCAISHVDFRAKGVNAYEQLFLAIDELRLGEEARIQAWLRMCLNVLAANCDDHAKNFSFLLPPAGTWRLSPAYDVTHAFNPNGEWTYQHLMSVNGKFAGITWQDLHAVADRFDVPGARRLAKKVSDAVAQWPHFAKSAGLDKDQAKQVQADFPALRPA